MLHRPNGSLVRQQNQARGYELTDPKATSTGGWLVWTDGIGQTTVVYDSQGTAGLTVVCYLILLMVENVRQDSEPPYKKMCISKIET